MRNNTQRDRGKAVHHPLKKFVSGNVLWMSGAHAVHDLYPGFLPSLLPLVITRLSLSKTEAGVLSLFTQFPSVIQPAIGHAADRHKIQKLAFLTPAVSAVLMGMTGLVNTYLMLGLLLLLTGISSAVLHALGPVITHRYAGRNLGRGMSFWMVGGELGRTMGPLVFVTAVSLVSFKHIYLLAGGGIALSVILFIKFRNTADLHLKNKDPVQWKEAITNMGPFLGVLALFIFFRSFVMSCITLYLPTFLTERGGSLWFSGASLSLLQASGMAGAFFGGTFSDRVGRRKVLLSGALLSSLFMFLLTTVEGAALVPVLLLLGFFTLSLTPVIMAMVLESFPAHRSLANGAYMAVSFVTRPLVVVLVGVVSDIWGLHTAYLMSGVCMALSLPIIFLLPSAGKSPT